MAPAIVARDGLLVGFEFGPTTMCSSSPRASAALSAEGISGASGCTAAWKRLGLLICKRGSA
jgi:hypothetical protein